MALPKRRHSNSRSGKRRSHQALREPHITYCPQCSTAVLPHRICPNCGYYQGRTVLEIKE
jgi:large subunit ribosomal protein L32